MFEFALFGQVVAQSAEWSTKEVLMVLGGTFVSIVGLAATIANYYVQHITRGMRTELQEAKRERDQLKAEHADLIEQANKALRAKGSAEAQLEQVQMQANQLQQACEQAGIKLAQIEDHLGSERVKTKKLTTDLEVTSKKATEGEQRLATLQGEINQLKALAQQKIAQLQNDRTQLQQQHEEVLAQLNAQNFDQQIKLGEVEGALRVSEQNKSDEMKRIRKALKHPGQMWLRKVKSTAPEFKGLDERRTPIISVLNLKGGVGKTTLTANLGAALANMGHRPLLVDLDLQGSLGKFFISNEIQAELAFKFKLLENFLHAAFDTKYPHLVEDGFVIPVLEGKAGLVVTSDDLAYAENNLLIRWMLDDSPRDPRFLMRRELHLKKTTNNYDVVLLDCPPLLNLSCINALAASDYLIIPVMPSAQATVRVPPLLRRVREFRDQVNPDLKVMGIIANRTSQSTLTLNEKNLLNNLAENCKDAWGQHVRIFNQFVKGSIEFRSAEDENRPVLPGDEMANVFNRLAEELRSCLPAHCLQPQAKPEGVPS
jgi:cellulose biosynthesis protein BcsQ/cell division protein FtsL/uncharacterized small protein (DUF1192 family)